MVESQSRVPESSLLSSLDQVGMVVGPSKPAGFVGVLRDITEGFSGQRETREKHDVAAQVSWFLGVED